MGPWVLPVSLRRMRQTKGNNPLFVVPKPSQPVASTLTFQVRIDCEISATMAGPQPNQPPQPLRAKAKAKRRKGRKGKQTVQPPQPALAEAKAEAKAEENNKPQGIQPQPPQPPLGNVPKQGKQRVKARRRRGSKGKFLPRTAPSSVSSDKQQRYNSVNSDKRRREEEECEQAEVNPQSKRLRVDSPSNLVRNDGQNGGNVQKEIAPLRSIKPKAFPLRRSSTPLFPKQSYFVKPISPAYQAFRLQRSKTYRANLKAKRDFPHTLKALSCVPNSDTDSEYTPISRVDSIPTSGQSTPEAPPEPISNEDLFGLRAKPSSPVPPTPSTWSLSSHSSDDVP